MLYDVQSLFRSDIGNNRRRFNEELTSGHTSTKWISGMVHWARTNRIMVHNFTQSAHTTRADARVYAFIIVTSLV